MRQLLINNLIGRTSRSNSFKLKNCEQLRYKSSRVDILKRRPNKDENKASRISTMFTITTITHPTVDTKHPLLLLQSEHGDRFLFGKIPEGTQRTFPETKTRLAKLENIFLTGELDWSSIGGLPGMILTLADQGVKKMDLYYGNDILAYVVSTWRYFVFRFGINLKALTVKNEQVFKNKLMTVKSIVVSAPDSYDQPFTPKVLDGFKTLISAMFPHHEPTSKHDPSSDPNVNVEIPKPSVIPRETTSYEVEFNPIRGRFRVDEAIKLGVPKGPLFAQLTQGRSVVLDDGSVISPDQVLEKQRRFAKVLILDVPGNEYLVSFKEKFRNYDKTYLGAVYFFLGEAVEINQEIISFMETFRGENVQFFVSHNRICPNSIVFKSSAITTLKLKAVQSFNYNLPRSGRVYSKDFCDCFDIPLPKGTSVIQENEQSLVTKLDKNNVHVLLQQDSLFIEPFTEGEEVIKARVENNFNEIPSWETLFNNHVIPLKIPNATFQSTVHDQLGINNFNNLTKRGKVEIVTFGTGSALPSKYRNVISTLVKIPYNMNGKVINRSILLDAGENTLGAILRSIPDIDIPSVFHDLKLIFLSHLHADHHLGIVSILKEWYKHNKSNPEAYLYLITPWQYQSFVREWFTLEDAEIIGRIRYISCEHLISGSYVRKEIRSNSFDDLLNHHNPTTKKRRFELDERSSFRDLETIKTLYRDLKIKVFQTCRAKHCDWAYSGSLSFFMNSNSQEIFKVSYSGDTRPNIEKFANGIGYRSHLLIHEATLDNDLMEDAIKKRHCTINEAISVSNAMEAEKLILTHFSQRYPKLPQMDNNLKITANEYCFAFDGMIVDFEKLGEQSPKFSLLNRAFVDEKNSFEKEEKENNSV